MKSTTGRSRVTVALVSAGGLAALAGLVWASVVPLTIVDFRLRGTQVAAVPATVIHTSDNCLDCHSGYDVQNDPHSTWAGSKMALAGRNPLFFAQMATANQDAANAGYFCMRCHVPMSFVTGHAYQADGSTLDATDKDGVTCHFCHSMVDPVYRPGLSPPEDLAILNALPGGPPRHYGNAMFVLDPTGTRRGPRPDAQPPHEYIRSDFFKTGEFCGTCHEVGNVAVSRRADGTYGYNALNQPTPDEDPWTMFPLERTYSEWKLSAFASGGVDMGGRFGGTRGPVVSTCQDCHMPGAVAAPCLYTEFRGNMARHEFAGSGAQVLDIIAAHTAGDPAVDQAAIARARDAAVRMLKRAATLETTQRGGRFVVRVINESGHKLPTGHIEGRRVWVNAKFYDAGGRLIAERGRYDLETAELHGQDTTVFEMHVGLSAAAAKLTGYAAGPTGHMALADTIEKDNRIPPRGFVNAAFESAGAPVVGAEYADGQHWADVEFAVPPGAASAEARLYYQNTPKEYIEELLHNNRTDHWGRTLHALWERTGRGAPIEMARAGMALSAPPCSLADVATAGSQDPTRGPDGRITAEDLDVFIAAFFLELPGPGGGLLADVSDERGEPTPDGVLTGADFDRYVTAFFEGC
ncbi:MAG: hypothetical protein JNJ48_04215 [Phycisphaerae bacterium]|nr:hypothetical protein [Phycisphaerae bacterium]